MADNNKCEECGLKAPRHRKTCSLRPENNSNARDKAVSKSKDKSISLMDAVNAASAGGNNKPASGEDRYHVTGFEELATRIRAQKKELDSLETEHKKDKKELAQKVKEIRLELERNGQFHSTLLVDSNDHDQNNAMLPVMAVFQDKYSKAPASEKLESVLKDALGDHYDTLFSKKVAVSLKKNVSLETLKEELGSKAYDKLCALTNIKEEICPRSGFMEARFAIRAGLNDDLNQSLDDLVENSDSQMKRQDPLLRTK